MQLMGWAEARARATARFAYRLLTTRQIWREQHGHNVKSRVLDRECCSRQLKQALPAAMERASQGEQGPGTRAIEEWLGQPAPAEHLLTHRIARLLLEPLGEAPTPPC